MAHPANSAPISLISIVEACQGYREAANAWSDYADQLERTNLELEGQINRVDRNNACEKDFHGLQQQIIKTNDEIALTLRGRLEAPEVSIQDPQPYDTEAPQEDSDPIVAELSPAIPSDDELLMSLVESNIATAD